MSKPKIFVITGTPKNSKNILLVKPEMVDQCYCAVINVSDSVCATFDYQRADIPSFWFPVNEIEHWGYSPFFGALKVVNEYYYEYDKPVLLHCHAGANRSPSVGYAILLAKGYTPQEAEESIQYEELSKVFQRNIERNHIPKNIVEFLKLADNDSTDSLSAVLRKLDSLYDVWARKKFDEQNDCILKDNNESVTRLIYNKEKKKFVSIKEEMPKITPWIDPIFQKKEWYITPTIVEPKK